MRVARCKIVTLCLLTLAFFVECIVSGGSGTAWAAKRTKYSAEYPLVHIWKKYNPDYVLPNDGDDESFIRDFKGPAPPEIPEIEFYEYDLPPHLQGRVESLVHGIKIGLPAEYDYYGYEIRRYMRVIGRVGVYQNRYAMETEIANIEKAAVVFKYWRRALLADIDALEKDIAADTNASPKIKQKFHVNKAIVNAFFVEMKSWLYANEKFLEFLADNRKGYTFENGYFIFQTGYNTARFFQLFEAKEKAKRQLRKNYVPFGNVVY